MLKLHNSIVKLVEPFRRYKRRWYDANGLELDYNVVDKDSYIRRTIKEAPHEKIIVRVGKFDSLQFYIVGRGQWFSADTRTTIDASYNEFMRKTFPIERPNIDNLKVYALSKHGHLYTAFYGIGGGNKNKLLVQTSTGECIVYEMMLRNLKGV